MKFYFLLLCLLSFISKAQAQISDSVFVGDKIEYAADFGNVGSSYAWATTGGQIKQTDPYSSKIEITWGNEPGVYPLTVVETSPGRCSGDTTKILVWIREQQGLPTASIPNVFTPNGDGNNDCFIITANNYDSFNLQIFNRWGETIFESKSEDNKWDGNKKGNICLPSYYYYILTLGNKVGNRIYKGFVALEK